MTAADSIGLPSDTHFKVDAFSVKYLLRASKVLDTYLASLRSSGTNCCPRAGVMAGLFTRGSLSARTKYGLGEKFTAKTASSQTATSVSSRYGSSGTSPSRLMDSAQSSGSRTDEL